MASEEKWPKVGIIVLNWNGWRDTIECLESLYQITYPNYMVVMVDNGSKDKSIEMIRKYCEGELIVESKFISYNPENKPISIKEFTNDEIESNKYTDNPDERDYLKNKLIIIKNQKNCGFAKGNNVGIEFALKNNVKYVFMLNNDTVVAGDFLEILVNVIDRVDEVGIAGPTCYFYDTPNIIWQAGIKINWWTSKIRNIKTSKVEEVDCVSGCAMLIKKTVFENISLLDTRFPFGYEDFEFCTRARRNSFKVVHVPDSKIWHKISISRNKLMKNREERNSLLGETGDFRLKDRLFFFRVCSPRKVQRISQIVFYFVYILPLSSLLSCKKSGVKTTLIKAGIFIKEMIRG